MEVGLREANQHFSKIMKAVRGGEEVLLTERGKPLARIVPVRPAGGSGPPAGSDGFSARRHQT